jgi:uncharacterized membrane protein
MAATTPPLSLGEILDRTVQLYRRNFLLLVGIAMLPAGIDVLLSGGIGIYFASRLPDFAAAGQPGQAGAQAGAQAGIALLTTFLILGLFLLLAVPLIMGVVAVALSALNYAASLRNRGEEVTIRASYNYAFSLFWRHVGILFLQFLLAAVVPGAVFMGILFIGTIVTTLLGVSSAGKIFPIVFGLLMILLGFGVIVVCIYIWLRFSLAFPASFAEGKKAWPSLQRSNQLSKGSRGRIFVMYLLVFILTIIAYYALTLPPEIILKLTVYKSMPAIALMTRPPLAIQVVGLLVSFLERALVMPIYAIALLLFYNDQRTRQEGYDIELLMAQAGWQDLPAPPPATLPESVPAPALEAVPASPPLASAETAVEPFVEPVTESTAPEHAPMQDSPEGTGA